MKTGNLIRVVSGTGKLIPPYLGQPGIVIGPAERAAGSQFWRVLVTGKIRRIHESYLEVINESR